MALNYRILGRKIQHLRNAQKISQMAFAEMISTSSTFVSRLERGVKGASLETLVLIADVLQVSLDYLLAESRTTPLIGSVPEEVEVLADCTVYEQFILIQGMKELKRILREGESIRQHDTEV